MEAYCAHGHDPYCSSIKCHSIPTMQSPSYYGIVSYQYSKYLMNRTQFLQIVELVSLWYGSCLVIGPASIWLPIVARLVNVRL